MDSKMGTHWHKDDPERPELKAHRIIESEVKKKC